MEKNITLSRILHFYFPLNLHFYSNIYKQKVEEWNKDDEIHKLKEKIAQLNRKYSEGFDPSRGQWELIEKWQEKHIRRRHKPKDSSGEHRKHDHNAVAFTFEFGYTPLGIMGSVVCNEREADAFRKSLGDKSRYKEIIKNKDAEFFIGEV